MSTLPPPTRLPLHAATITTVNLGPLGPVEAITKDPAHGEFSVSVRYRSLHDRKGRTITRVFEIPTDQGGDLSRAVLRLSRAFLVPVGFRETVGNLTLTTDSGRPDGLYHNTGKGRISFSHAARSLDVDRSGTFDNEYQARRAKGQG